MDTRSSTKEAKEANVILDSMSDLLDEKLKNLQADIVASLKKELSDEISKLFKEQSERIVQLEATVAVLKNSVTVLKDQLHIQNEGLNDLEQYGRRQCLRIEGCNTVAGEKADDVLRAVKGFSDAVGANIPDLAFDRAHRVGKPYKIDNIEKQSVIVRFSTFRHRSMLYYKRKEMSEKFGVWVRLDFTKKNYGILNDAKEYVKDRDDVNFVYSDINCRLKVKLQNNNEFFFKNMGELMSKLN